MLTVLDHVPAGLLERPAPRLHEVLPGPTLIHLPGRRPEPLFVSVLLHGNEDVGWEAARGLLAARGGRELPRALSLFIGNVAAARHRKRHLADQPDYNRIWKGGGRLPEHAMVEQVLDEMRRRRVFAAIDVHNNTGRNPHYACINRLEPAFEHLALLFSRTVVYFRQPDTVLSLAFARLCPAITIECGRPGEARGVAHALECLEAALHLSALPRHPVAAHDIDLYHTVAVLKVPRHVRIGFGPGGGDLRFIDELDRLNFTELAPGALLGFTAAGGEPGLCVFDEDGRDVTARYLDFDGGEIRTRCRVTPSMFTRNPEIIHQDCLGYFMERLPPTAAAA